MSERIDSNDDGSDGSGRFALRMTAMAMAMLFVFVFVFGGWHGYMDFLDEKGTEEVCDERWGEESEYVGDTGFASSMAVCDTPEGQKHVDIESAPMGLGTLLEYIGV